MTVREYDEKVRSQIDVQRLKRKLVTAGVSPYIPIVATDIPNNGRNIIVTANYIVEGAPKDYVAKVTIRQGRKFLQKDFTDPPGPGTQFHGATPEGQALTSLWTLAEVFVVRSLGEVLR